MDLTQLVSSDEEFGERMESTLGSLVVVHYFLKQSTSCAKIEPVFRQMSFKFQGNGVEFLKVDADLCKGTIQSHKIKYMPTFVLYRNMVPLALIQGAKPLELEIAIREHILKERTDSNQEEKEDFGFSMGPGGLGDLFHFFDPSRCECLNGSDLTPFGSFVERKSKLLSDADEQLILVYGFNQLVKIKSLKIKGPIENGPSSLKLFINQVATLDFDDVSKFTPTQEIRLTTKDLDGDSPFELSQARFHDIRNVHIFIPSNMSGSDVTELDFLTLYGEPMNRSKGIAGKNDQVLFLED